MSSSAKYTHRIVVIDDHSMVREGLALLVNFADDGDPDVALVVISMGARSSSTLLA